MIDAMRNPRDALGDTSLPPSEQSHPKYVLVVEDHRINCNLIVDVGRYHGLNMLAAHDGETALELLHVYHPCLILMDIQLEGQYDGFALAEAIKADPEHAHVSMVAITAFAMKGDRERIFAAGYAEYIVKPFELQQLVNVFRHYT